MRMDNNEKESGFRKTIMRRLVEKKHYHIAKRLTAILTAVVFVHGMIDMPTGIYAVETDAVDNGTSAAAGEIVEPTETTDEAAETEATEAEVTETEATSEAVETEAEVPKEMVDEESITEDLLDITTVDPDSLDESEYDGFIYKLDEDVTKREAKEMESAIDDLDASEGQEVEEVIDKELYKADSIETIAEVAEPEMIEYIEPNYIVKAMGTTDPYYTQHGWYLDMINAPYVWDKGMFGDGVKIAILDSGVNTEHEELAQANIIDKRNLTDIGDVQDITDNTGHGTAVTGVVAASQNNGKGLAGIMPRAGVIAVKVMDYDRQTDETTGSVESVVRGIDYAVNNGANVINISAGILRNPKTLEEACQDAAAKGVIIVAAVGNDSSSIAEYPASYNTVVGVGSIERDGAHSSFSNFNQSVAVTAPGRGILAPYQDGGYASYIGTSLSTPQVAAMAVMVKQMDSSVNYTGFVKILAATSTDKGAKGFDPYFGYGLMNLKNVYDYMAGNIAMYETSLSCITYTYDGTVKTPRVTVNKANKALSAGYYRTTYASGRKNVGTYKVTVEGVRGYIGTRTLSFNIVPPLVKKINAPKKGKKKLTVRWKAMSKKQKKKYKNAITGYQVRVSTNKRFTNAKYAGVKGIGKTQKTVKGLKKKKTYYVQYRSYKTVGSKTYYSQWSGIKKAKTK